jgi:hypothetical protein
MTAVEWLVDEYFGGMENCTPDFRFHIQQAKEMEKEQIKEAYVSGFDDLTLSAECYYTKYFTKK